MKDDDQEKQSLVVGDKEKVVAPRESTFSPYLRRGWVQCLIMIGAIFLVLNVIGGGGDEPRFQITVQVGDGSGQVSAPASVDASPPETPNDITTADVPASVAAPVTAPVTAPVAAPVAAPTGKGNSNNQNSNGQLHPSTLPHLTKEEIMNPRDLYANLRVPVDFQGENLASISSLKKLVEQARKNYFEGELTAKYGKYTEAMFGGNNNGKNALNSPAQQIFASEKDKIARFNAGRESQNIKAGRKSNKGQKKFEPPYTPEEMKGKAHLVHKLKLKLVQVQLKFLEEKSPSTTLTRFVHINGGHSASASHGNFFDESYTAAMERFLRPVFRSIGINYVARNMAAGGTSSFDEVAMCSNAYFGKEVDILSSDYGMLDGKRPFVNLVYGTRAILRSQLPPLSDDINDIPSRPALMVVHMTRQMEGFAELERRGIPVVLLNEHARLASLGPVPNMGMIKEQATIDALPSHVKYFRCSAGFEVGDEGCQQHKYNQSDCKIRSQQASWHPGYKMHEMEGTFLALGILNIMEAAMDELALLEPPNESKDQAKERLTQLFHDLNNDEQSRYDEFFKNFTVQFEEGKHGVSNVGPFSTSPGKGGRDVPKGLKGKVWVEGDDYRTKDIMTIDEMMKTQNFCHMAKMPSDQRLRGLLTENFELTTINPAIERTFEEGILFEHAVGIETNTPILGKKKADKDMVLWAPPEQKTLQNPPPHEDEFILVGIMKPDNCTIDTFLDGKDVFFLSSLHGKRGLTLPNPSERQFYTEYNPATAKGWILACFGNCLWGKCDPRYLLPGKTHAKELGDLEVTVNGVPVAGYDGAGGKCRFMKHNDASQPNQYTWKPSEAGTYNIQAEIKGATKYSFMMFSSFVFY